MYQFVEKINQTNFFWFDKKVIENLNWALLPKSSKAVFPVIACHCDENGIAFPSERTIAILSGRTEKIVRSGINGLDGFPGFQWDTWKTRRGKRAKKYQLELPKYRKGTVFPFFKETLESGHWRELVPTAQALYPVLRYFGFFNLDFYNEAEETEFGEIEFMDVYENRHYDFVYTDCLTGLAKHAGISRRSIYGAIDCLRKNNLFEYCYFENGLSKIYIKSKFHYKRSYLNKKIMDSFRHVIDAI